MDLRSVSYVRLDDTDGDIDIEVYLNEQRIGEALSVRLKTRLHLADIRIKEGLQNRRSGVLTFLTSLRHGRQSSQLRGHGIGSELLYRLLRAADESGIQEVWGFIMPDDLKARPSLLEWYESFGFTILPPDAECLRGAAKKIVRLQPSKQA